MKKNTKIFWGLILVVGVSITLLSIQGMIVSAQDGKDTLSSQMKEIFTSSIKGDQTVNDMAVLPYDASKASRSGRDLKQVSAPAGVLAPELNLTQTAEVEPNGTIGTATPIATNVKVKASNLFPNGDIDFYSFPCTAGDRVHVATMTSFSAGSSTDSQITLIANDQTTTIEFDDDNGSLAGLSSSIAGAVVVQSGTCYLRINDFTAGTTSERPYDLYLMVQSGAPTAEVEPNDTPATANVLPASGYVSGARNPAVATEQDWYSVALNAGDTLVVSMDLDPERDGVNWNGRLGIGLFGDATNQIIVVDDAGTGDVLPVPNIPSEFFLESVKTAGTYYVFVDSASAAVGGPTATYRVSAAVIPKKAGLNCTNYTSTDVPKTIGPGAAVVSSTLTVPGSPRIQIVRPFITMNHTVPQQMDVHLRSPNSNDNGLWTDIGSNAVGGQTMVDLYIDDEAGIPLGSTVMRGFGYKPELNYRMWWFYGENAGGVWNLDIYDDVADANGGTLTAWGLEICEQPAPTGTLLYSEDFEAGDGGYTHSGAADEWERGLPATAATTTANPVAPFLNCNSGTNCWKTDLDNTYNVSSSQDLVSPTLNLTQYQGTITLGWAMRYQMESASFDHANVQVTEVGNPANTRVVWQFLDATMTNAPGNPAINVPASAGWGNYTADISSFAGKVIQVTFHLDSDTTINFGGMAIDDVSIRHLGVTAASVPVSGRVLTADGRGISGARVTLSDINGNVHSAISNGFGYYRFDNIMAGRTYTLNARSKRYVFNPVFVNVGDEITGLDITAQP